MRSFMLLTLLMAACNNRPTRRSDADADADADTDSDADADTDADTDADADADTDADADADTDTDTDTDFCSDSADGNHTQAHAVPLATGTTYSVDTHNPDFFTVSVPNSTEITIDVFFAAGDIDARLREQGGPVVANAISSTPNEQLVWQNTTGTTVTATLEVLLNGPDCYDYTVQTSVQ